jgi:hypothetical protein
MGVGTGPKHQTCKGKWPSGPSPRPRGRVAGAGYDEKENRLEAQLGQFGRELSMTVGLFGIQIKPLSETKTADLRPGNRPPLTVRPLQTVPQTMYGDELDWPRACSVVCFGPNMRLTDKERSRTPGPSV